MNSLEIYKKATETYKKAMEYHDALGYDKHQSKKQSFKSRENQQTYYDKAIFFYKLYEYVVKEEERKIKNEK